MDYEKGCVFDLMEQGGPTDVREPYFKDAVDEMMRARVLCAKARNVRPYAFVENVVTHVDFRGNGYAGKCLDYARKIAEKENCYKLMLLTGSKKPETLHFYEKAGYNSSDKTAFIQWI